MNPNANPSPAILRLANVSKTFRTSEHEVSVLHDISFDLPAGSTCAVIGPSGSGKTTLLSLCAGLEQPSSGTVELDGHPLASLSEDRLALLRNRISGFVFQSFRLLPSLTALENVLVPAELQGDTRATPRARELLHSVGLADRLHHYPSQLSGGEQQRVALARAFINSPRIIFADEPTGNLDTETGARILDLLFDLNRSQSTTLLLVTHDHDLTRRVSRILTIKAGIATARENLPEPA
ncbi:MAG TPA: ABC transporter ATP-binding protein [Kiritimatiellia bacterium]|nr:ABC transporter ATP-binding protein [Kiritimatiellia bacterium]